MNLRYLALLPVVILTGLIFSILFFDFSGAFVINPPYLLLVLNLIFWTIGTLAIAFISVKSYLKDGSLTILLLSSSIIIFGLSVIISGWVGTFSGPLSVAVSNPCLFVASILQVLSSIISLRRSQETTMPNRRRLLVTTYAISIVFVVANSALVFSGNYPAFFSAAGPTLLRQVVLGSTVFIFAAASIIFAIQFIRIKSVSLYWYALAIALLSIGLFSAVEVKTLGDVPTWLGRTTLYVGTVYLVAALFSSKQKATAGTDLAGAWAESFKTDRGQISTLFSKMLDAFCYAKIFVDSNGKPVDGLILEVNDAFEQITGIKREDAVGKKITELVPGVEDDPAGWIAIYGHVAISGEPAHFENYLEPLKKWYHVSAYSPKRGYYVSIFEDITERKKAEEQIRQSQKTFYELVERSPFGIYIVDSQFRISHMNVRSQNEAFRNVRPIIGRLFNEAMHTLWPDQVAEEIISHFRHTLETGEPYYSPRFTNPRHDVAAVESYEWELQRIMLQEGYGVICYYFDSSKLRQTERALTEAQSELKNYAANLERLIEERTKQLKDVERLAAIGATAGMVGHDIRNPLQAIVSDLFIARQETKDMPDNEAKKIMVESIDEIEANIFYIEKIVGDLQDYARPLNPHAQESNMESIVKHAITNSHIPKNIKTDNKVATDAQKVMADPDFLKRVISNLTLNAVQAMPNGGKLTIRVKKDKETGDVTLSISDTGVGIPEAVKEKLFTPMFTTKSKGQGFGLAVVKRLTESLGGTISFKSQEGKGTTFTIRLPQSPNKKLSQ